MDIYVVSASRSTWVLTLVIRAALLRCKKIRLERRDFAHVPLVSGCWVSSDYGERERCGGCLLAVNSGLRKAGRRMR